MLATITSETGLGADRTIQWRRRAGAASTVGASH
jgi:hypothetical protein